MFRGRYQTDQYDEDFLDELREMANDALIVAMHPPEAGAGRPVPNGRKDAVQWLMGFACHHRAMFEAAKLGNTSVMEMCIKKFNKRSLDAVLRDAAEAGQLDAMRLCKGWLDTWDTKTFFEVSSVAFRAALGGHIDAVKLCMEWDRQGNWPRNHRNWGKGHYDAALLAATSKGHTEIAELCKARGAGPYLRELPSAFNGAAVGRKAGTPLRD